MAMPECRLLADFVNSQLSTLAVTGKIPPSFNARLRRVWASAAPGHKLTFPVTFAFRPDRFGYFEGKNLVIEWRSAGGEFERLFPAPDGPRSLEMF